MRRLDPPGPAVSGPAETAAAPAQSPPGHAEVVVIGGGVVGASVAYHLAAGGCRDVVLLERAKIGSGTTWHAAGNMETYRADPLIGEMVRYAVEFYPRLEAETGQALGWRQTGRVMFTHLPERMAQYRGLPALGRARGIDIELLTPRQVAERLPIVSDKGLVGGAWIPSDGRINPTDLAVALAKGAKRRGARIVEDAPVLGMTLRNGGIESVTTTIGTIKCRAVVIAAGLWSPQLGAMIGVRIPLHAVQHLYVLTKPIDIVSRDMPLFISYDERLYGREDVGGLLVGFFDSKAIPVAPADLPRDFSFGLLDSNWDQVEANMAIALERFPVLQKAEIRTLLNGPESFTPDMQMLLGEAPAVRRCYLATGMNSSGIALSAAAGRLTAEWILDGRPSLDATRLDIRRFADSQALTAYARDRASEVVTHMCRLPVADLDFNDTRMIRRSPLHDALAARGAHFVSVLGWERPIWFTGAGDAAAQVEAEVAAAERSLALFDRSSDCKLRIDGPRAEGLMRKLSGAVGDVAIGAVLGAPMLNKWGGVEALPIVVRLAGESWLLIVEPEQATRLRAWIDRLRPASGTSLVDVSSGWAAMALAGPKASALLDMLCGKLPDERSTSREIELGYAPGLLLRWPAPAGFYLLTPTEFAAGVHERIADAGGNHGLRHAGSLAAGALAIAQGARRFGTEANPQISAVAAGIDASLDLDANRAFIGRAAVARERRRPPARQIRAFTLACRADQTLTHAPVLRQGRPAGYVTNAAHRASQGKAVLLALVERAGEGDFSAVVGGETLLLRPARD
jgi:glycine/D-amino acid oxidase-like deaminating enzyme/glycine cleavage system aminomethyltransferase T